MKVVIHINPTQPHHAEHAQWFRDGLERHGLGLHATHDIGAEADIHIISGPHYAHDYWLGKPNVLMIDRAYWHSEKSGKWHSMDWVSLGWLQEDGSRYIPIGEGRPKPEIKHNAAESGTIFLMDYGMKFGDYQTFCEENNITSMRPHPDTAGVFGQGLLTDSLHDHKKAIGYRTSALITAALEGLEIKCLDHRNIMYYQNWRDMLAFADWKYSEIQSGEAWSHLLSSRNPKRPPSVSTRQSSI